MGKHTKNKDYPIRKIAFLLSRSITRPFDRMQNALIKITQVIQSLRDSIRNSEIKVHERAKDLDKANKELEAEIDRRKRAEEALKASNQQLTAINQQLRASEQQMRDANQQLDASNQQLRASEQELRKTRDYLDNLFNYANAPIIVWNPEARITRFNHAFEHLTGYTAYEVIDQKLNMLFPETSKDASLGMIRSALRGEYWESIEIPILRKDGDVRIALWNSANIYAEDGITVIATIAQGQDITQHKKAEKELVRREKLAILGQLAGGVGHELRNPLGVISNAVYYLKMIQPEADDTIMEYLETISQEVNNSIKIVSDLLDLSRIKPSERKRIDVSDLINQVLDRHSPPDEVEVTTEIASDLPSMFVDSRQIGQVFNNLLINAYQAMSTCDDSAAGRPEGGELTIMAKVEKDKIVVSITDTGCGISKENMENLFEPLFTTKARGIGLGLAVSKNLVVANGGRIKVESEEGKGSTFTVILPTRSDDR